MDKSDIKISPFTLWPELRVSQSIGRSRREVAESEILIHGNPGEGSVASCKFLKTRRSTDASVFYVDSMTVDSMAHLREIPEDAELIVIDSLGFLEEK